MRHRRLRRAGQRHASRRVQHERTAALQAHHPCARRGCAPTDRVDPSRSAPPGPAPRRRRSARRPRAQAQQLGGPRSWIPPPRLPRGGLRRSAARDRRDRRRPGGRRRSSADPRQLGGCDGALFPVVERPRARRVPNGCRPRLGERRQARPPRMARCRLPAAGSRRRGPSRGAGAQAGGAVGSSRQAGPGESSVIAAPSPPAGCPAPTRSVICRAGALASPSLRTGGARMSASACPAQLPGGRPCCRGSARCQVGARRRDLGGLRCRWRRRRRLPMALKGRSPRRAPSRGGTARTARPAGSSLGRSWSTPRSGLRRAAPPPAPSRTGPVGMGAPPPAPSVAGRVRRSSAS
jgi:hypothetical protein